MTISRARSTPTPLPTIAEHAAFPPACPYRAGQRVLVSRHTGQLLIATCLVQRHPDGRETLYLRLATGEVVAHVGSRITILRTL